MRWLTRRWLFAGGLCEPFPVRCGAGSGAVVPGAGGHGPDACLGGTGGSVRMGRLDVPGRGLARGVGGRGRLSRGTRGRSGGWRRSRRRGGTRGLRRRGPGARGARGTGRDRVLRPGRAGPATWRVACGLGVVPARRARRYLRDRPLRERRLRASGHRYGHGAKAHSEYRCRSQAGEPHHAMAPTGRIRKYRPRFHDGSVSISRSLNWGITGTGINPMSRTLVRKAESGGARVIGVPGGIGRRVRAWPVSGSCLVIRALLGTYGAKPAFLPTFCPFCHRDQRHKSPSAITTRE